MLTEESAKKLAGRRESISFYPLHSMTKSYSSVQKVLEHPKAVDKVVRICLIFAANFEFWSILRNWLAWISFIPVDLINSVLPWKKYALMYVLIALILVRSNAYFWHRPTNVLYYPLKKSSHLSCLSSMTLAIALVWSSIFRISFKALIAPLT